MALIVPALINWLWQASLLTLAVALAFRVGPRLSASTRERIWWIALAANLVLLAAAFSSEPAPAIQGAGVAREPLIELPPMTRWPIAIALLWAGWIAVHLARVAAAVFAVCHAIRHALPLDRHQPPGVRLVLSTAVRHAAVLGWRRPVIALAPGTMAQLSTREIDQVVLHELAHVRRRDPWALLVQHGIWTIAGFHPAMWWLDRAITLDRERACDDWVLAAGASSKQYGACLLKLVAGPEGISLAPGAAFTRGELSKRIGYLLESGRDRSLRGSRTALMASASVVASLTVLCASYDLAGYTHRVAAAVGLDIALVRNAAPALWTIASLPPSRPAVNRATNTTTMQAAGRRVDDARLLTQPLTQPFTPSLTSALDASTFGVHVPVPVSPRPQALPPIEARALPGDLSAPEAIAWAPIDLSRDGTADQASHVTTSQQTPWEVLADAGKVVGSGSRKAGVGTGRAFSRLGRSIASVF